MASTTQVDACANAGVAKPASGMMLPVQALTTGFVHEVLPLPLHASQMSLDSSAAMPPLAFAAGGSSSVAMPAAGQGSATAWVSATSSAPAVLAEPVGQAMQMGPGFMEGALPPAAVSPMLPAATSVMPGAAQPGVAALVPSAVADDTQSRQGVRIGDVGVMLTYEDSSELTDLPDLYYLPNAPVWVKGLANLHGNLVPVFDVAQYLGVQSSDQYAGRLVGANKAMLLVLGHGADAAGVIIEGIPQRLVPMPQQQTDTDTAPALLMPHIQAAYFIDNHLWFDLDCNSLLNMLEQAMMQQA